MLVRVATEADASGCANVMIEAMSSSDDYKRPKADDIRAQCMERVSGYLAGSYYPGYAKDERAVYVAERSGEIIGFIAGHRTMRHGGDAEVQWAFVLPEWQRRGIGSSLFALLKKWFTQHRLKKVYVNAPVTMNTRAFYEKHGAHAMT